MHLSSDALLRAWEQRNEKELLWLSEDDFKAWALQPKHDLLIAEHRRAQDKNSQLQEMWRLQSGFQERNMGRLEGAWFTLKLTVLTAIGCIIAYSLLTS